MSATDATSSAAGRAGARRYFADVRLFDGRDFSEHAGVLVTGEQIGWVGADAEAGDVAAGAERIEGRGRLLTPGLIDCHVHLCFDAAADFVAGARVSESYAALRCVRNGQRYLRAGVTTVRDLGGVGTTVPDVAQAIADGVVKGPRVIASGRALTVTGGHGWSSFALEADGAEEFRHAVRLQLRAGARSIKLVATGGVLTAGIPVDFEAMTGEEIEAAIDEAHRRDAPVAAHAIGKQGIAQCVDAGIDSIEHGFQIDDAIAARMAERGTFHVATISSLASILDNTDRVPAYVAAKAREVIGQAQTAFGVSLRNGVRIACGTDAGTPFNLHGRTFDELRRMVDWGLPAVRAWQAATSEAAALLRLESVGRVAPGQVADLALWDRDPLEDRAAEALPALVLQSGRTAA